MTHKTELDILDIVFGYSAELDVAMRKKAPAEEIERIKSNHKKHLSRDKRKLEQMFENAKTAKIIISYTKKQIGIGKHKVPIYVYSWKRKSEPNIQVPDEQ